MDTPDFNAAAAFVAASARLLDRRRFQRLFEGGPAAPLRDACDWLTAVSPAEGGAAFVEPTLAGWPHAPWWVAASSPSTPSACCVPTRVCSGYLASAAHGCDSLPDREAFDKSHNHQVRSARRLMLEAVYRL